LNRRSLPRTVDARTDPLLVQRSSSINPRARARPLNGIWHMACICVTDQVNDDLLSTPSAPLLVQTRQDDGVPTSPAFPGWCGRLSFCSPVFATEPFHDHT
jgi:hypothetical protein